jgi:hypothetical protein
MNINAPTSFEIGGSKALMEKPRPQMNNGCFESIRRWVVSLGVNFRYDRSNVNQTLVREAIINNPQIPALLSATSAKAKFYTTTFEPSIRYNVKEWVAIYGLAGFGWLRRSISFSGVATQGNLLQPNSPDVFGGSANSGAFDAGAGIDFGVPGHGGALRVFAEWRVTQGLAVNGGTRLQAIILGLRR